MIENQPQIQYQAKLQAQRSVLSGLITAPPSNSVPVSSSLVFNPLQLPSPPPSPDAEREELAKYISDMGQYDSITPPASITPPPTISAGNILNSLLLILISVFLEL